MGISISPLNEDEIPTFVRIELAAFRSHPRMAMLWPAGYTDDLHAYYNSNKTRDFHDPGCRFVKAVDDATGEIIAASEWTFAFDTAVLENEEDVDLDGKPPANWPARGNWEMRRFFNVNLQKWKRDYLRGRRYIQLDILVTHPDFHGRGAGTKLLSWGTEQADKEGVTMALEATPAGLSLYKRFGFREMDVIKADMKQFGWKEAYEAENAKRVWMIREPRVENGQGNDQT